MKTITITLQINGEQDVVRHIRVEEDDSPEWVKEMVGKASADMTESLLSNF